MNWEDLFAYIYGEDVYEDENQLGYYMSEPLFDHDDEFECKHGVDPIRDHAVCEVCFEAL